MPSQRGVVRGAQRHQQRVNYIVYEVQDGGEEQPEVPAQSHESHFGFQTGKAGLQGEYVENYGRYRTDILVVVVFGQQYPLEDLTDVATYVRYDAGDAQNGRNGVAARHHQVFHQPEVGGVAVFGLPVSRQEEDECVFHDSEEPEGSQHFGHVQSHPLGLYQRGHAKVGHKVPSVEIAAVDSMNDGY